MQLSHQGFYQNLDQTIGTTVCLLHFLLQFPKPRNVINVSKNNQEIS